MKAKQKPAAKPEKQDSKEETALRQSKATLQLRNLAKQGNSKQLFRLMAMQKPAKKPKEKEADK